MGDFLSAKVDADKTLKELRKARSTLQYKVNGVLGKEGDKAARWIARTYLRGKAMKKITGETIEHFGVRWNKKRKGYYIRPGYGVRGNQNYLARYVGTAHEFVKPGLDAYMGSSDVAKKIEKTVEGVLKGLE